MQAFRLLLLLSLLLAALAVPANPTWSTTPTVKTGVSTLFSTLHGAGTSIKFSVNFPSAFVFTPFVAYGLQSYRGT